MKRAPVAFIAEVAGVVAKSPHIPLENPKSFHLLSSPPQSKIGSAVPGGAIWRNFLPGSTSQRKLHISEDLKGFNIKGYPKLRL